MRVLLCCFLKSRRLSEESHLPSVVVAKELLEAKADVKP